MVVGGAPEPRSDHCAQVAALALHMIDEFTKEPASYAIKIGTKNIYISIIGLEPRQI